MSKTHLTEDQIQRMIASDPDAPEATAAQLAQARPFTEAFPALSDALRRNMGGRPKVENPKVAVSLRLDQDVVARFLLRSSLPQISHASVARSTTRPTNPRLVTGVGRA